MTFSISHQSGIRAGAELGGGFEFGFTTPAWMADATCAQTGIDDRLWFPEGKGGRMSRELKALCAACPAREACLEYAVTNRLEGFWAATNDRTRRDLRRNRNRTTNQEEGTAA